MHNNELKPDNCLCYFEEIQKELLEKEYKFAVILIENNITSVQDFIKITGVDELYARYLFGLFERKSIISKKSKGEKRKILIDIDELERCFYGVCV